MKDDYKYVEDMSSVLALKGFKIKLMEARLDGDIIPERVMELLDNEIDFYGQKIHN